MKLFKIGNFIRTSPTLQRNWIAACGTFTFSIWVLIETYVSVDVSRSTGIAAGIDAATYPRLLAILGLGLSVLLFVASGIHAFSTQSDALKNGSSKNYATTWLAAAGFVGYVLLLPVLGFWLATPPVLIILLFASGMRHPLKLAAAALFVLMTTWWLFGWVLKTDLPDCCWN
jgi:hypothetical protein